MGAFEDQGLEAITEITGRKRNVERREEEDFLIHYHSQLSIGGCDVKKAPLAVDSHSVLVWIVRDSDVVSVQNN